ncbi:hypothetical protein O181_089601 [Austropuccinia psidii MF-1]|uniref:Uncharacterized protein n=1 Tax=Austropuccinia psidii MF-1 TaxID=1389203 RepID=A0A9Q3ITW4_9BASI|nr:hypothetical protein [Austropuccinia psidii MF-1]
MEPDFKEGDQVLVSTLNFNNLKGLSQPQISTPLNGCCGNSNLNPSNMHWPYNMFMANCTPFGSLWPLGHNTLPLSKYGLRPYPTFIGPIGQFPTSPTPRPLSLFLGLRGLLSLPGAHDPSSNHQGPCSSPLY